VSKDYTEDYHVDCPPLEAGEVLAPGYEILEHLHQSNSFDVYDVFSEERTCRCIAKAPRQDLLESAKVGRSLVREGRLLGKLTHPHLVRAYETIREPYPVLILETLTGETLAHLIDSGSRRLPVGDVVHLGLHLCSAIHYLHRHNVLHLDLKPSNIVSERQMAKILDLSIARPPGRGKRGIGTDQYMSPEQARGDYLGPPADVWGIGATLYEAATGEYPFNDYDDGETGEEPERSEQLERRADSIRVHRRVPRRFADVVDGCLEPDPAQRPTVDDLARSLTALICHPQ
jgi:serine/threonine protein kinase